MPKKIALLTGLLFSLFFPIGSAFACTIWEHQWLTLSENREFTPDKVSLAEAWKTHFFNMYKRLPAPEAFYDDTGGSLEAADSSHTLLNIVRYEDYTVCKIDERLMPVPVIKIENLTHSTIRWVEMTNDQKIIGIDETNLCYGYGQTMILSSVCPTVYFQRILDFNTQKDLFTLLEQFLSYMLNAEVKSSDSNIREQN